MFNEGQNNEKINNFVSEEEKHFTFKGEIASISRNVEGGMTL